MSTMKRTTKHVFAVIRVETDVDEGPWTNRITIKEILHTEAEAQDEVKRLTSLNRAKGCEYFWQMTRLVDGPGMPTIAH